MLAKFQSEVIPTIYLAIYVVITASESGLVPKLLLLNPT